MVRSCQVTILHNFILYTNHITHNLNMYYILYCDIPCQIKLPVAIVAIIKVIVHMNMHHDNYQLLTELKFYSAFSRSNVLLFINEVQYEKESLQSIHSLSSVGGVIQKLHSFITLTVRWK